MLKSFFWRKEWALWAWGGIFLLISVTWLQVYLTVLLNSWYGKFYDILQKASDIQAFWHSMIEFTYIAIPYIFIAMFAFYFAQHYSFRWRQAITFHYLPHWENSPHTIEGASQRIQQDTYEFAKSLESLGLGMFRAALTLIAFIPILWTLSSKVTLPYLDHIEGSLVWIALITSIGGILISYFVGIKLPGLEYNNQRVEAAYRKQLVYSEDDKAFANIPSLTELFTGLRTNYFRMFNHYSYFTLWSTLYSQVMIILPYLLMAPSLFTGAITLGIVTQTGNAFGKVNDSFSYLIDRWTDITKFISVVKRLNEFEKHLIHGIEPNHPNLVTTPKDYSV
ncbi:MAG: putative transporter [Thiotrichales bacterium]|nr:putative transporter [Thiotrichales bacterium]MBN2605959.1 putative transporter [Thiotrichales bacterium]